MHLFYNVSKALLRLLHSSDSETAEKLIYYHHLVTEKFAYLVETDVFARCWMLISCVVITWLSCNVFTLSCIPHQKGWNEEKHTALLFRSQQNLDTNSQPSRFTPAPNQKRDVPIYMFSSTGRTLNTQGLYSDLTPNDIILTKCGRDWRTQWSMQMVMLLCIQQFLLCIYFSGT